MSNPPLRDQALALPLADRIRLAEARWRSIAPALPTTDDRDTHAEARQRDAELTISVVAPRRHADVMAPATRALGCP